ncbi:4'-phosphopantetheinyl transferase family protein, partial [Streptosporangium algeriense]
LLGLPPRRVPLTEDARGRPALRGDRPRYDFNLSHSGNRLALSVARGLRVGIDVERVTERDGVAVIARRYFGDRERQRLDRSSDRSYLERWYRIWTTREAHAKARGTGVSGIAAPLDGHGSLWCRRSVRVGDHYVASVVALTPKSTTHSYDERGDR